MAEQKGAEKSKTLAQGLESLFITGKFSDFTISSNGQEFKVHKAVLCSQSEYFLKACEGDFKEAKENRLQFDDEDSYVVEAMIGYFYTEDYKYPPGFSSENQAHLEFHARVFALAGLCMLDHLQQLSATKFNQVHRDTWINNKQDLGNAISIVYTMSEDKDSKMRVEILIKTKTHFKELFKDSEETRQFQYIVRETPRFGIDLAKHLGKYYF